MPKGKLSPASPQPGSTTLQGQGGTGILSTGQNYLYNSGNAATGGFLTSQADLDWRSVDGLETGDLLAGGAGTNRLFGTVRSDLLFGAAGADTMTGGPGVDLFRYIAPTEGVDSITDFQVGVDKVQVLGTGFANLAAGALSAGNFVSGASPVANNAAAKFLHTTTIGMLSFDADGTGAGVAVNLVTLVGNPALIVADIVVV